MPKNSIVFYEVDRALWSVVSELPISPPATGEIVCAKWRVVGIDVVTFAGSDGGTSSHYNVSVERISVPAIQGADVIY